MGPLDEPSQPKKTNSTETDESFHAWTENKSLKFPFHCHQCPFDVAPKSLSGWKKIRMQTHLFFDDISSSRAAAFVNFVSICMITLATIELTLSTVKELNVDRHVWEIIEAIVSAYFCAEYILRIIACRRILKFIIDGWNLVDLLSFLPYFLSIAFESLGRIQLQSLRLIRLVRLFRALNMPGLKRYSRILWLTLTTSWPALMTFGYMLMVLLIIIGSFFYDMEIGYFSDSKNAFVRPLANTTLESKTPFQSVPEAFWWFVQTIAGEGFVFFEFPVYYFFL